METKGSTRSEELQFDSGDTVILRGDKPHAGAGGGGGGGGGGGDSVVMSLHYFDCEGYVRGDQGDDGIMVYLKGEETSQEERTEAFLTRTDDHRDVTRRRRERMMKVNEERKKKRRKLDDTALLDNNTTLPNNEEKEKDC
eukprot:scaffold725_cov162-Ochromonas_danica.AAC.29